LQAVFFHAAKQTSFVKAIFDDDLVQKGKV
jgi:hypothetical protein